MAYNIYLGNLPEWVTADDIRSWLHSSDLVCDEVRVIRDFETQQSKGYAFVEAPNEEEMDAIIRRFNRAPIDGKLLRAKAAHPKGDKPAQTAPAARKRKRRTAGRPARRAAKPPSRNRSALWARPCKRLSRQDPLSRPAKRLSCTSWTVVTDSGESSAESVRVPLSGVWRRRPCVCRAGESWATSAGPSSCALPHSSAARLVSRHCYPHCHA